MEIKLIGNHEKDPRPCRDALALTLKDLMAADPSICYVDCDLMGCINTKQLRDAYPDRAYEAGIAEGNAAGLSAGMAAAGKTVFFHSFGTFSSRRCYDQIYMSAAYAGLTVHVLGSDPGVTAAYNGGTHMPLEDGAMYCSIPEATVLDAADFVQLKSIVSQLPGIKQGITYTRFPRKDIIQIYEDGSKFEIGKGVTLRESAQDQAAIIASGILVDEALKAQEALAAEGISVRVIDMFTWKPLDEDLVVKAAAETGAIVTAENHNVTCGLGAAVAGCLARKRPTVQEFVGVQDRFGQVGPQSFLMDEYGLRAADIVAAVKRAIARK
nr:transketolase C-terminal domain-containing protein [uncultured Dysosmobacter sp.]